MKSPARLPQSTRIQRKPRLKMIDRPRTAGEILAAVGLTADEVRRVAEKYRAKPQPPPERDLRGIRFVRVVRRGAQ